MAYRLIRSPQAIISAETLYGPAIEGHFGWSDSFLFEGNFTLDIRDDTVRVVSGVPYKIVEWFKLYKNPTIQRWTWIEGSPAVAPSATQASWAGVFGWNSGGRTLKRLLGSGTLTFKLSGPVGAVAGFSRPDAGYGLSAIEHGWYAHDGTLEIIESGQVVHTFGSAPLGAFSGFELSVRRQGSQITYLLYGSEIYVSESPSEVGAVVGMGIPYSQSDFVEGLDIHDYEGALEAKAEAKLGLIAGAAGSLRVSAQVNADFTVESYGTLGAFSSTTAHFFGADDGQLNAKSSGRTQITLVTRPSFAATSLYARGFVGFSAGLSGQVFDFTPEAKPFVRFVGQGVSLLEAKAGPASTRFLGYESQLVDDVLAVGARASLDAEIRLTSVDSASLGSIASLSFSVALNARNDLGISPAVSIELAPHLAAHDGVAISAVADLASQRHLNGGSNLALFSIAELETLPPLEVGGQLSLSSFGVLQISQQLVALDGVVIGSPVPTIDGIGAFSTQSLMAVTEVAELEFIPPLIGESALALWTDCALEQGFLLSASSGLLLITAAEIAQSVSLESFDFVSLSAGAKVFIELELSSSETLVIYSGKGELGDDELGQYAINLDTGAVSSYRGAAFLGYARAEQASFGWRSDGLYRLGTAHDELGIDARIDFGSHSFGAEQLKHLVAGWVGLRSDAQQVRLTLSSDDGTTRTYVMRGVDSVHRAMFSKGAVGRIWNVTLELDGASHAVLDGLSFDVIASQRRRR